MKSKGTLGRLHRGHLFFSMVLAIVFLAFAGNLAAQDTSAENMQLLLDKIKADKKLLVAENMQLNDAEAKSFWPLYDRYQDELFLIRTRTAKLINDYADAYQNMTDAAAKRLLGEYIKIETLRLKLHKAYLPRFSKVLPGAKVVRYYQIENKINAALEYELASRIPLVKIDKK
jgi:hypothetical protein